MKIFFPLHTGEQINCCNCLVLVSRSEINLFKIFARLYDKVFTEFYKIKVSRICKIGLNIQCLNIYFFYDLKG